MIPAENTAVVPSRGYRVRRGIGVALVVVGVPMLLLPGPGLLAIGAGLALIGYKRPGKGTSTSA
jgi:hypothetical protein